MNIPLGISAMDLLKSISLNEPQNSEESQSGPLYPLMKHIHMMEPVIDEEISFFCVGDFMDWSQTIEKNKIIVLAKT